MTARTLINIWLRRWYVVAAGAVLTLGAVALAWRAPGVYWTRFDVQFAPPTWLNPNSLAYANDALADTAAVITMKFNDHTMSPGPATPGATLVGLGVRRGYSVRVTDFGLQWSHDFRPAVDVQVVDSDPAAVERQSQVITARLGRILQGAQAQLGAPPRTRIMATRIPHDVPIYYQAGSHTRAAAASLLTGIGATGTAAVLFDGWATRRGGLRRPKRRDREKDRPEADEPERVRVGADA